MDRRDLEQAATPEQLATAFEAQRDALEHLHGAAHHEMGSVREAMYRGHVIRIVTQYEVSVDGQPITGHFLVNNEGRVHYHAIPNQEFDSAVDVVKRIIDL